MIARLDGVWIRRPAGSAGTNANEIVARAVRREADPEQAAARLAVVVFTSDDHRAGAVTEQQGGIGVSWVERPRLDFGGRDETGFDLAASNHGISHGKPIQESGTGRRNIEGRHVAAGQLPLDVTRRRGKRHVRRSRRDQNGVYRPR